MIVNILTTVFAVVAIAGAAVCGLTLIFVAVVLGGARNAARKVTRRG